MTTVFVADDHPLYRGAVVDAINDDARLELVGQAGDGVAALEQLVELRPDVAILDVNMPGLDGPEVARRLKGAGAATRVLFLSAYDDGTLVLGALSAGGAGFLSKDAGGREICDAVSKVARGEAVLTAEAGTALIGELHANTTARAAPALTEREQQVLEGIAAGLSAAEIGASLHLSTATIKTHSQSLYAKLGVGDRGAAVAAGMRRGLLR
jgi:two-component system nitrate/nitrite response regulator NarL